MPQIMPWWCPHTNEMFPTKALYLEHVKALAADRYDLRMRRLRYNHARAFILENIQKVSSLENLTDFIVEHAYKFYLNGLGQDHSYLDKNPHWRTRVSSTFEFTKVEFRTELGYGRYHHHGQYQYGFHGRLAYEYKVDPDERGGSNPFAGTGIITGSGGGYSSDGSGVGRMNYEVSILEKDWPTLFIGEKLLA